MVRLCWLAALVTLSACSSEPIVAALPGTARNVRQIHRLTPSTRVAFLSVEADLPEPDCLTFLAGYAAREGLTRSTSAAVWHRSGHDAVVAACVGDRLQYRRLLK